MTYILCETTHGGQILIPPLLGVRISKHLLKLRQILFSTILLTGFSFTPVSQPKPVEVIEANFDISQLAYVREPLGLTPLPEKPQEAPRIAPNERKVVAGPIPPEEVKRLIDAYFPAHALSAAYAIAKCESGWRSDAVGDGNLQYYQNGIRYGASYGIFQIRYLPGRPAPDQLLDAEFNVKYAANLYQSSGWGPWSCKRVL